jgi:hypothetical protein
MKTAKLIDESMTQEIGTVTLTARNWTAFDVTGKNITAEIMDAGGDIEPIDFLGEESFRVVY